MNKIKTNNKQGSGDIVWKLRGHIALAEDQSSTPNTQVGWVTMSMRRSDPVRNHRDQHNEMHGRIYMLKAIFKFSRQENSTGIFNKIEFHCCEDSSGLKQTP